MARRNDRRPRVIQVITHLDLGGAEEVAISLAEALHEQIEFVFFAVQGVANNDIGREFLRRLTTCGIQVYSGTPLGMKYGGALHAGLNLSRLIQRLKPAVVHLHTEIPEMTYACATLFGVPATTALLRTVHNTSLWPAWARVGAWAERRLGSASVAAVSQGGLEGLWHFQRTHQLPLTQLAACQVIYNGVGSERPAQALTGLIRQDKTRPVRLLFAGRFEPQKGVDLLPAIVEQAARQTTTHVNFYVLGSGSYARTLESWAALQTTSWQVQVEPPVPNLAARLREGQFDLVLMPSRFEGLALVAIEALLAGRPVIATKVPGLLEVFPEAYELLADAEDVPGIARLLADTINHLDEHQARAQTYIDAVAARFSVSGMAARYLRLYQGLGAREGVA